jgi:hypothetical protein
MERDISGTRAALSVSAYAAGRKSLLPLEYAKYKNRPTDFILAASSLCASRIERAVPVAGN